MDLGKNHFRHINPRKKKTMLLMLDAYLENVEDVEKDNFVKALSIYFENNIDNTNIDNL